MDDLVEWLRVQLDEDERVAQEATPGPWHEPGPDSVGEWNIYGDGWVIAATQHYSREDMQNYWPKLRKPATVVEHGNENAAHIALHDPARVLRDAEAKRRILDRCIQARADQGIYGEDGQAYVAEDVLQLLALPYSDRPGYRQEWAPPDA